MFCFFFVSPFNQCLYIRSYPICFLSNLNLLTASCPLSPFQSAKWVFTARCWSLRAAVNVLLTVWPGKQGPQLVPVKMDTTRLSLTRLTWPAHVRIFHYTFRILYLLFFIPALSVFQALPLPLVTPFPTSMKPVSFWSGPFHWRLAAGRTSATISYAGRSCQRAEVWTSADRTFAFCPAESVCLTPQ